MELKIQPEALEIPVPRHFVESGHATLPKPTDEDDATGGTASKAATSGAASAPPASASTGYGAPAVTTAACIRARDRLVSDYMSLKLGVDRVLPELEGARELETEAPTLALTTAEAVAIIARNERGRQGKLRCAVWRARRQEEMRAAAAATGITADGIGGTGTGSRRSLLDSSDEGFSGTEDGDGRAGSGPDRDRFRPAAAASNIQRVARGFLARRGVARARAAERVFIGMAEPPARPRLAALEAAMASLMASRAMDTAAAREA
jgi:hypothetical protein